MILLARINTLRLSEVLDYERDIKGKRLIRLSAGVGAGKNYAFAEIAKKFPDLRILLITSRKNTAIEQMQKMNAVSFSDFDKIQYDKKLSSEDQKKSKRMVCTHASIDNFIRTKYNPENPNTYLWDKFDLIILDEAHSLTTDATFTDCFYTEKFLKHTYYKNKKCDIVFMTGTQEPIDWLFNTTSIKKNIYELDFFDKCVHLEPDEVYFMPENTIKHHIKNLWSRGERVIYFANYKSTIARLTTELMKEGIPEEAFGFSFNYDDKEDEEKKAIYNFPQGIKDSLKERIQAMDASLISENKVPQNVKILFTTSKNKEGINIIDDDIKNIYAETHNKPDLIQIAGRVRGNPENGTGIEKLIIVSDAKQFFNSTDRFISYINLYCTIGVNHALNEYKKFCSNNKVKFLIQDVVKKAENIFNEIRYDYIDEKFAWYQGRYEGKKQSLKNCNSFDEILYHFNEPYFRGQMGAEIFRQSWFKWSTIYSYHTQPEEWKSKFNIAIQDFLTKNNYIGKDSRIYPEDSEKIKEEICRLANLYGYKNLDIPENFSSLGRILKKINLEYKAKSHNTGKTIYTILSLQK